MNNWHNCRRRDHRLRVAPSRRHLEYADGTPFFYLGDTAWQLFHRLTLTEALRYLDDRVRKGFTVIQAVVVPELDAFTRQAACGAWVLHDRDPARPTEDYLAHVDAVLAAAAERGLIVGLLPTWGRYTDPSDKDGIFTPENAFTFGRILGTRWRAHPLIWILGGDYNPRGDGDRACVNALAHGLRDGDGASHLASYHPCGPGRSSDFYNDAPWIDFHMCQSSHAAHGFDNGLFIEADYALQPTRPCLDGEPRYETIPAGFYFAGSHPCDRCDDNDVRHAAYWALLSGACGHTYGHNSIWQFFDGSRPGAIHPCVPWQAALDHPGAFQMAHVRRLMESRPWHRLAPAQDLLADAPRTGPAKVRAAIDREGTFAFVYSPHGEPFTVTLGRTRGPTVRQTWYDPRCGAANHFHTGVNTGFLTFTPPNRGPHKDWLLVLDDPSAAYPAPGNPFPPAP